jgi:hypothetical protein
MRSVYVFIVSAYLLCVGVFLVLTGRLQAPGFKKIIKRRFRRPYSGAVTDFQREQQHCWLAAVPDALVSDREAASWLVLFEDGRPLGPAHSPHSEVRTIGKGRYAHWGAAVYFSTSDNSDPRTNGRRYSVAEKRGS